MSTDRFAVVRVDIRGSGDSEGVYHGEYLAQEQEDCAHVLRWIAAQPWCSGSVGMYGKSWGGFNGLQMASLRPPELKSIVSLYSTSVTSKDFDLMWTGFHKIVTDVAVSCDF